MSQKNSSGGTGRIKAGDIFLSGVILEGQGWLNIVRMMILSESTLSSYLINTELGL
jgi:hypothetical protein